MPAGSTPGRVTLDDLFLGLLGFDNDLQRKLTTSANFAVAFSIICVPGTITSSLQLAWTNGGPAAIIYGWGAVSVASLLIGLSMGEIVSALPSCGGPFFWASVLAGKNGPFVAWITGWFNLLGQVSIVAAAANAIVTLLAIMLKMAVAITLSQSEQLVIYAACLVLAAGINSMHGRQLSSLIIWSSYLIFCSVVFMALLLPTVAPWHRPSSFVWTTFYDHSQSPSGITNNLYLFLEGMMMPQYCIIGYDCCAHMSEETIGAEKAVPVAILLSIVSSSILGYILLLSFMFCVQDLDKLLTGNAGGYVAAQISYDVFHARFGSGLFGVLTMIIPLAMMVLCLIACMLAGSRMVYSFSRNSGLPKLFSQVNHRTHTPLRAVWLLASAAFVLGLPVLKSSAAFLAVVSATNVGLLVSYAIPIICRHTFARQYFKPGVFHLGKLSVPIGYAAVAWAMTSTVVFLLPANYPITLNNFNFAPVVVACVVFASLTVWFLPKWGAQHYFIGPQVDARIFHPQGSPQHQV